MKTETIFNDGCLRICLDGELDHHAAKNTMTAIENAIDLYLPRQCILDLGGLTFMDSSGIAVILKTHRRMREIDGNAAVENIPKQPMRVIDTAGIDRIVKITATTKQR